VKRFAFFSPNEGLSAYINGGHGTFSAKDRLEPGTLPMNAMTDSVITLYSPHRWLFLPIVISYRRSADKATAVDILWGGFRHLHERESRRRRRAGPLKFDSMPVWNPQES
jgi:hypothetical protein